MATVIKSSTRARNVSPIAFNFEDVTEHANRYVEEIQTQAEALIANAQRQAESVTHRAEESGREAALRAVEKVLDQKVSQKMETLMPALQKVVTELSDAKQSWLRHWERSSVELAAKIAQRVIRRELSQTPEITIELMREALQMAAGAPHLKISLNPADFATLGSHVERLTHEITRTAQAEIVANESITPGGCLVETQHGLIDQQVETQLERIIAELTGENE